MPTSRCLQEQGRDVEEFGLGSSNLSVARLSVPFSGPSSPSAWLEDSWTCLLGWDSVVGGRVAALRSPWT